MIETKPPQALSLADLIGREWTLPAPVEQLAFNANGSAVACRLDGGGLALLSVADGEHPEKRIRVEVDTGRTTIRPRENPLPQPVSPEVKGAVRSLCPLGAQGFAIAAEDGVIWRVTARGQALPLSEADAQVSALCDRPGRDEVLVARGGIVTRREAGKLSAKAARDLGGAVTHMAVSRDSAFVAARCDGRMVVMTAEDLTIRAELPCNGTVHAMAWSDDGHWIVAGCQEKSLIVLDVKRGAADEIEGFPGPVQAVAFNARTNALLASGAFRVVGWRCPDLPFGTHHGDPIETGKPGLTLVEHVASNPQRDSCAVGYANGLVTLCPVGKRDELMLIDGRGQPVTALQWSPDGAHLAVGFADGRASLLTFPKAMFK